MKKIRDGVLVQVKIPYEVTNKIDQMAVSMNISRTDVIRRLLTNGTAFMVADSVCPVKPKSKTKAKAKAKSGVKAYDPAVDGYPRAKDYVGRESELKRNREIYFKS